MDQLSAAQVMQEAERFAYEHAPALASELLDRKNGLVVVNKATCTCFLERMLSSIAPRSTRALAEAIVTTAALKWCADGGRR